MSAARAGSGPPTFIERMRLMQVSSESSASNGTSSIKLRATAHTYDPAQSSKSPEARSSLSATPTPVPYSLASPEVGGSSLPTSSKAENEPLPKTTFGHLIAPAVFETDEVTRIRRAENAGICYQTPSAAPAVANPSMARSNNAESAVPAQSLTSTSFAPHRRSQTQQNHENVFAPWLPGARFGTPTVPKPEGERTVSASAISTPTSGPHRRVLTLEDLGNYVNKPPLFVDAGSGGKVATADELKKAEPTKLATANELKKVASANPILANNEQTAVPCHTIDGSDIFSEAKKTLPAQEPVVEAVKVEPDATNMLQTPADPDMARDDGDQASSQHDANDHGNHTDGLGMGQPTNITNDNGHDAAPTTKGGMPKVAAATVSFDTLETRVQELLDDQQRQTELLLMHHMLRIQALEDQVDEMERELEKRAVHFVVTVVFPNGHSIKPKANSRMTLGDLLDLVRKDTNKQFVQCTFAYKDHPLLLSRRIGSYGIDVEDNPVLYIKPTSAFPEEEIE